MHAKLVSRNASQIFSKSEMNVSRNTETEDDISVIIRKVDFLKRTRTCEFSELSQTRSTQIFFYQMLLTISQYRL